jgi:hypothetical protein
MAVDRSLLLGAALGGIGLLFVVDAALSKEAEERADEYSEFEEQHYQAFGFRREEESVARQLVTWAMGMVAIGYVLQTTPELLE